VSPLLRLPDELRKQIYGYVLGGRTIHIRATTTPSIFEVRVCKRSEDYDVNQAICKVLPQDATNIDHHAYCDEPLDLGFLRTSRQVYSETRLEPFRQNRFAVSRDKSVPLYRDSAVLLSAFLKNRLVPSQINAIANLIIEEACYHKWCSSVPGLNRLKFLNFRIFGVLRRKDDRKILFRIFTDDFRIEALLRQQKYCPLVRVSLELHSTMKRGPRPADLERTQSRIEAYATAQNSSKRNKWIMQEKKEDAKIRAASRQKRGLRPLRI
jgi:hypothetical protein